MTKITKKMTLRAFAVFVARELEKRGIDVVLTGGAVVSIYSNNKYVSNDVDFLSSADHEKISEVMRALGFTNAGKDFQHADSDFSVDFPGRTLLIGNLSMQPDGELKSGEFVLKLLSPTQWVMDRLAAFFHWKDRQSLEQAVLVASKHPLKFSTLKKWAAPNSQRHLILKISERALNIQKIIFLFFICFSCTTQAASPDCMKYIKPEDVAFADNYFRWLSGPDFDKAVDLFDPQLKADLLQAKNKFQSALKDLQSFQKIMIGCKVTYFKDTGGAGRAVNLQYEWSSTNAWYGGNLLWHQIGSHKTVYGLHLDPLTSPLEKQNSFWASGKGLRQWVFFLYVLACSVLMLSSFVLCLRTGALKRKWLWAIFTLLGPSQFSMNWTTGETNINPFFIQIIGGFSRMSEYAPWVLTSSIPVGAIVFLLRRRRLVAAE